MNTFWQDIRFGWRMLWKSSGVAAVCLLTLALGIGANSTIFSIVYNTLLKPLPFAKSDQLMMIWEVDPNIGITRGGASPAEFLDWREQNHVFQDLSAWRGWFYTLTGHGEAEEVWARRPPPIFSGCCE